MKLLSKLLLFVNLTLISHGSAESLGEKLANAVLLGRHEEVQSILSQNPDLRVYKDSNGNSLIHLAINNYNDGMVDLLIKHRVSVHEVNRKQESPIQRAAFFGFNKAVLSLLKAGAQWQTLSKEMRHELSQYSEFNEWLEELRDSSKNKEAIEIPLSVPHVKFRVLSVNTNRGQKSH